ncbi:hypothetical protein C3B79_3414 [Aeromonas hydrophila]|nr:hypothetical protein C3B79_3414 [Aeromonas hydrophila]
MQGYILPAWLPHPAVNAPLISIRSCRSSLLPCRWAECYFNGSLAAHFRHIFGLMKSPSSG